MNQISDDEDKSRKTPRCSSKVSGLDMSTAGKSIPDEVEQMQTAVAELDPMELSKPLDSMKVSLVDTINAHGSFAENLPLDLY